MRNGIFIADAHVHLFSRPVRLYGREVRFSADTLLKTMDSYGIDFALVIARPDRQLTIGELRSLHDELAATVDKHRPRLAASCWATPRLGPDGVDEAERCLRDLGYVGMKLHPAQEQFNVDDPTVSPLVDVARRYHVPVTVHTQLAVRGAEPWRMLPLAEVFPDVTFLMAHLGGDGGMVQSLAAAKIAAHVPNIAVEVSTTVTDPWATYAGPAEFLGVDRVYFGSDLPLHQVALNLLKLDLLDLPLKDRAAMAGGNLARLLGLDLGRITTAAEVTV